MTDAEMEEKFSDIEFRLSRGAERMNSIEDKLDVNNKATAEVLDIVSSARGFFRGLGVIGIGFKWIGGIAGALAGVWALIYAYTHNGRLP